jgi:hypothetical protein
MERSSTLASQRGYVDQLALAVAVQKEDFPIEPLPRHLNCFTGGFLYGRAPALCEPFILHYHAHRDANGFLRRSGSALVDSQIHRFNQDRAAALGLRYERPARREFVQWMLRRSPWTRRTVKAASRLRRNLQRNVARISLRPASR